ncbi:MAG TPA: hypothetical protein VH482_33645, partial [Thermomicrobiales bacterium]
MVRGRFSWLEEPAYCFGYTWNGMQLALDGERRDANGEPLVVLLDPSDGTAFEIDASFEVFHDAEIVDDPDNSLDSELFDAWSWAYQNMLPLKRNEIVAYKIPLVLGGGDTIENMGVIDFEVEWSLTRQIRDQLQSLTDGTPIRRVQIDLTELKSPQSGSVSTGLGRLPVGPSALGNLGSRARRDAVPCPLDAGIVDVPNHVDLRSYLVRAAIGQGNPSQLVVTWVEEATGATT